MILEHRIVLWCNGSTTVFGSVCPGSNPGKTTERKPQLNVNQRVEAFFLNCLLVNSFDFVILYAMSCFMVDEVDSD